MSEWALYKMLQLHIIIKKKAFFLKTQDFHLSLTHWSMWLSCCIKKVLQKIISFWQLLCDTACITNIPLIQSLLIKTWKCLNVHGWICFFPGMKNQPANLLAPRSPCLGRCSLLRIWWGTGAGCLQKLWVPHLWECSRPGWRDPEQPILVSGIPVRDRRVGTR